MELRKAKQSFFKKLQATDSKTFWKLYKTLTKRESSVPALLVPDVGVVSDDAKKANILNEYFFNNFNHTSTPSSCPWVDHAHLLNPSAFPEEFLCTEDQVLDLISSLDTKKASGADGISVKMIKATAPSIVCSLTKLFNLSLKSGKVPSDWKFARIVPIPKSGNPVNPSNYRPISILPVLSKLLEKHIHNIISYHLHNVCPLSPNQWGYTAGKSTTTALLSFTHECQEALDSGGEVCSVFFDLSKAFDTVPHQSLLLKLFHLQVNPFILRWIHSYLSNIDGITSSVSHSKVTIYADDIALYKIIKNPMDYTFLPTGSPPMR